MTIKKTSPNAISRKLQSVGFEKRAVGTDIGGEKYVYGFECFFDKEDFKAIVVINQHYGETNSVAAELYEMGYAVMDYSPYVTVVYGKEVADV